MNFTSKKPHYEHLRKKWTAKHRNLVNKVIEKHGDIGRQLAIGGMGGLMLLTTPATGILPAPHLLAAGGQILKDTDRNILLADELNEKIPKEMRALNPAEEEEIAPSVV